MINFNSKIYVAGHNGLVGSAIVRELKKKGYKKIITTNRQKLDLTNQLSVLRFLKKNKPNFIFLAAAKVGGVYSNNKYALVHLDADLYNPQLSGLEYFYTRTTKGGLIIIHDCNNEYFGSRAALDEFFLDKPETPIVIPDKSGSAIVVKQ